MSSEEPTKYALHAIQLRALRVIELSIKLKPDRVLEESQSSPLDFNLTTGYGEYDADEHFIIVGVGASIGSENEDVPYDLKVDLRGTFEVDDTRFPLVHIEHWARNNAPLVLYPYLREHVYGLTSRIGATPVLLPLFEVPTFRVQAPSLEQQPAIIVDKE